MVPSRRSDRLGAIGPWVFESGVVSLPEARVEGRACPGPSMLVQQRPAKSEQNMTKATRRARIDAVIRLLCDSFPQTFSRGQHARPLKVGVYADALAALGGAIQPRDLRSALRAYTSRAGYLRALTAGAPRVGIDGAPAGAVTTLSLPPDHQLVSEPLFV